MGVRLLDLDADNEDQMRHISIANEELEEAIENGHDTVMPFHSAQVEVDLVKIDDLFDTSRYIVQDTFIQPVKD